jgi:hypothetical protein
VVAKNNPISATIATTKGRHRSFSVKNAQSRKVAWQSAVDSPEDLARGSRHG